MRQVKSFFGLGAIIAVALVIAAMPGGAQKKDSQDLRGIWLGEIYWADDEPRWGGKVVVTIGEETLEGTVSQDNTPPFRRDTSVITGMDRGVRYLYNLGGDNTFVLELHSTAVYNYPPGRSLFGYYRDVSRIVDGTGRFANATGHVAQSGPYLVWFRDPNDPSSFMSIYTAELHGKIYVQ